MNINIVTLDYSLEKPISGLDKKISEFRSSEIEKVPIIRIFGSTDEGKKCCALIHGVFPYFYIPFDGSDNPNVLAYQLTMATDKTLNTALNKAMSNQEHIYNINLISAIPFYGFHAKQHQFFKISFYNPLMIRKAASLLQNGNILGKCYQPHECHIPFIQQFMIDFNLFGMNFIKFSQVQLRDKNDQISHCTLEFDVLSEHILNQYEITPYNVSINPGIQYICDDELKRRENNDETMELSNNLTQNRINLPSTPSEQQFLFKLQQILDEKGLTLSGKDSCNLSVYAAETPSSQSYPSSCESLLDLTNLDETLINEVDDHQNVLGQEALSLINSIFKSQEIKDHDEIDSVLSQQFSQIAKDEESDSDNEIDLSLSLAQVLKKEKSKTDQNAIDEDFWNCSFEFEGNAKNQTQQQNISNKEPESFNSMNSIFENQKNLGENKEIEKEETRSDLNKLNEDSSDVRMSNESFFMAKIPQLDGAFDNDKKNQEDRRTKSSLEESKIMRSSSSKACVANASGIRFPKLKASIEQSSKLTTFIQQQKSNSADENNDKNATILEEFVGCCYKPSEELKNPREHLMESFVGNTITENQHRNIEKTTKSQSVSKKINKLQDRNSKSAENDTLVKEFDSGHIQILSLTSDGTMDKIESSQYHHKLNEDYIVSQRIPATKSNAKSQKYSKNQPRSKKFKGLPEMTSKSDEIETDIEELPFSPLQINESDDIQLPCAECDVEEKEHSLFSKTNIINKSSDYDNERNIFPKAGPSTKVSQPLSTVSSESREATTDMQSNKTHFLCNLTPYIIVESVNDLTIVNENNLNTYLVPKFNPPKRDLIETTSTEHRFQSPFYGNHKDTTAAVDVGFNTLFIPHKSQHQEFEGAFNSLLGYQKSKSGSKSIAELNHVKLSHWADGWCLVEPINNPPKYLEVQNWSKQTRMETVEKIVAFDRVNHQNTSNVISGNTLNNTHGFKMTLDNYQDARSLHEHQYVTSLVMELHAETRGDLKPDPQLDAIKIIFYAVFDDMKITNQFSGYIYVNEKDSPKGLNSGLPVKDEMELLEKFIEYFGKWNPDILSGYEIEFASWGYLVDRASALGFNLVTQLSRIKDEKPIKIIKDADEDLHTDLNITGRIILDLWRILKHEIALQSYTFENLAYHVLHERVPKFGYRSLNTWWTHRCPKVRHRTIDYYLYRVQGAFRLMDHFDLINRTAELARLFGITFYEVLSRGSQFRVESMMLRLAKPYNYVPVSPNEYQRAHMKAPEFIALVMEPESKFYKDPVIVLDFQSLYPSIMIAHNYCFATCLGKIALLGVDDPFEFGAYQLKVPRSTLKRLLEKNMVSISPCGVAFIKSKVRTGILPRMLREILDTRLMVKKSIKRNADNKTLRKVLHSRQLGLKLIANVTYGYTAANFSGRMPCVEVADSVVSKGRETLQRAISLVEKSTKWNCRVVYGDTDSLFVLVPGRSKEDAFKIGEEIARDVTNDNPSPIKLKLEKVYQPCILQTKKRYVGYMYESSEQKVPEFEAKGIETVRRDGCPAASKMLEKTLKVLFDTRDVSLVKNYVLHQFSKIISGRVSLQDLTFAKEYRGRSGYKQGACVPALELARKWTSVDKRNEPKRGERVPYVIINGAPGLPLIRLVRHPHEVLDDCNLRLNATYYITKAIIPPLNRCFKLIGADLFSWYNEMPRKQFQYLQSCSPSKGPKSTINQYFGTNICAACSIQSQERLCKRCFSRKQETLCLLNMKINNWERKLSNTRKICATCCRRNSDLVCGSLDCPVLYSLKQTTNDCAQISFVKEIIN